MILGVDPGTRNIGFAVIDGTGRCRKRKVLVIPARDTFVQGVEAGGGGGGGVLPWGRGGGGVMGAALALGCRVYLVTPSMKKNGKKPKSWSDHEWDAFLLAKRALAPDETMRKRCSG